jgi:hypothetical protein
MWPMILGLDLLGRRQFVDEPPDRPGGLVDRRQVLALAVERPLLLGGAQREVTELQRRERALAAALVRVEVDVEDARRHQQAHAPRDDREVADRVRPVARHDRLHPVAHRPRVAAGREHQQQPLAVAHPRQRHDHHGDRHQPGLAAGDPVLHDRLALLDLLQPRRAAVHEAALVIEPHLTGAATGRSPECRQGPDGEQRGPGGSRSGTPGRHEPGTSTKDHNRLWSWSSRSISAPRIDSTRNWSLASVVAGSPRSISSGEGWTTGRPPSQITYPTT